MMKNVRMDLNYLGTTKKDDNWACHAYKATLKYGDRQLTTPFYTGMGWDKEPTADDILSSLLMDANSTKWTNGFEDWAENLGYDTDSRKAEKSYKDCLRTAEKLERFLGNDYELFEKKYENY